MIFRERQSTGHSACPPPGFRCGLAGV